MLEKERFFLSENASRMLYDGKTENAVNDKFEIEKIFIEEGVPFFEKVIKFQEIYGGISYKIGRSFYHGFSMNIFYFNEQKNKFAFRYKKEEGGKYYFQCMDYHYAGDVGPCIDQDGKIYDFGMGKLTIRAASIEEFLEDEAVKFYFVNKQYQWLSRGAKFEEFEEFKKNIKLIKVENDSFTGNYFEWWKDEEEAVFIRTALSNKYTHANVYCKDEKALYALYKENKPTSAYPSK